MPQTAPGDGRQLSSQMCLTTPQTPQRWYSHNEQAQSKGIILSAA
jgi:hypothetical protein